MEIIVMTFGTYDKEYGWRTIEDFDSAMKKLKTSYEYMQEKVKKMQALIDARRKTSGIDIVISSSRIPNHGLYTIDKKWFSEREIDMTSKGIIEELFNSSFNMLGYMPEFTDINKS